MTRIGRILTDKINSIRFIRVIHKPVLHSLSVLIFLKQRIGSRNQVSHRPNGTDSQVTVQDDDVGIFSALQRTRIKRAGVSEAMRTASANGILAF